MSLFHVVIWSLSSVAEKSLCKNPCRFFEVASLFMRLTDLYPCH
jgi:hypothetical protein